MFTLNILLTIDLIYLRQKSKVAEDALRECVNTITMLFHAYQVSYTIEYDRIIELPKLFTIRARIIRGKTQLGYTGRETSYTYENSSYFKLVMYLICHTRCIAPIPKFQNQFTRSFVRRHTQRFF